MKNILLNIASITALCTICLIQVSLAAPFDLSRRSPDLLGGAGGFLSQSGAGINGVVAGFTQGKPPPPPPQQGPGEEEEEEGAKPQSAPPQNPADAQVKQGYETGQNEGSSLRSIVFG